METIYAKESKTLKRLQALQVRKQRKKYKQFIVEGLRAVRDMAERKRLDLLVIKESLQNQDEIQTLVEYTALGGIRQYALADDLFEGLVGTVTSQGIIGVARMQEHRIEDFCPEDGLYLLLDSVQDPGNVGTLIRTAVAAGVKALFLSKGSVDVYNDKTIRSAVSGMNEIAIYEDLSDDAIQSLITSKGLTTYVATLTRAKPYRDVSYAPKTLIVLGNEANGVRSWIQEICQQGIHIPMYGPMESLNVAVAGGLVMFAAQENRQELGGSR